jgi:hypothetical protein
MVINIERNDFTLREKSWLTRIHKRIGNESVYKGKKGKVVPVL